MKYKWDILRMNRFRHSIIINDCRSTALDWDCVVELAKGCHQYSILLCLRCIARASYWMVFYEACLADFISVLEFFQPISHIGAWHTREKCTIVWMFRVSFCYDNDAHKNLENGISKMRFTLTLNTTRACDHMECCLFLFCPIVLAICSAIFALFSITKKNERKETPAESDLCWCNPVEFYSFFG